MRSRAPSTRLSNATSTGTTTLGTTSATGNVSLNSVGAVSQSGALAASGLELKGDGAVTLTNTGNNIATVAAATGAGDINVVNSGALTVGTLGPFAVNSSLFDKMPYDPAADFAVQLTGVTSLGLGDLLLG